jgi:hypothetical protein
MNSLKYSILVVSLSLIIGIFVSFNSWDGTTFIDTAKMDMKGMRDPAGMERKHHFTSLDGPPAEFNSKSRMIKFLNFLNSNTDSQGEQIGIQLGNFAVTSENGQKDFVCQKYDRVILQFEADGFAMSGERPRLEVEGHCEIEEDVNHLVTLWIPFAKIISEVPADGELDIKDPRPVVLKFSNIGDEWPQNWTLMNVKIQDVKEQNSEISMESIEIREVLGRPLQMNWISNSDKN